MVVDIPEGRPLKVQGYALSGKHWILYIRMYVVTCSIISTGGGRSIQRVGRSLTELKETSSKSVDCVSRRFK